MYMWGVKGSGGGGGQGEGGCIPPASDIFQAKC